MNRIERGFLRLTLVLSIGMWIIVICGYASLHSAREGVFYGGLWFGGIWGFYLFIRYIVIGFIVGGFKKK